MKTYIKLGDWLLTLETKETGDKLDQQYNLPKLNFLYNGEGH